MIRTFSSLLLMLVLSVASAQPPLPKSIYAISAAGLASAMSYCIAKHGPLREGSPAARCYASARAVLAATKLRERAAEVDKRCQDPGAFNECITPEVGRLVYELNEQFTRQSL